MNAFFALTTIRKRVFHFCTIAFLLSSACTSSKQIHTARYTSEKNNSFLEELLKQQPGYFDHVLKNPDSFRVQIIYTQINRSKNNRPAFTHHYFNVDPAQYFYPASTVKMPVALTALEKLKRLKKYRITRESPIITESELQSQTPVYNDPTTPDGKPTIAHYIKKIFLVSDNDASNRLYEFVGQEYLNNALHKKGYQDVELLHRLSVKMNEEENRHTNPVTFLNDSGTVIYPQPAQVSALIFQSRNILIGNGYIHDGKLVSEPFNFSKRNQISLPDLQSILQSVLFPLSVRKKQRFNISGDDRIFLLQYLSQYPAETTHPHYDSSAIWDGYGKFLLWGSEKGPLPKHIRVFNKSGGAYGFLTDVAYMADFDKSIEFMLSATIYCNSDGIFNDDRYDYEKLGFPFMKHLGQIIYEYESKRNRRTIPDLSAFKMKYDR